MVEFSRWLLAISLRSAALQPTLLSRMADVWLVGSVLASSAEPMPLAPLATE